MPGDDRVLDLIGDTYGVVSVDEFRQELLDALRRAVPADWISLNDIGPVSGDVVVLADPPPPPDLLGQYVRYAAQNPLTEHYARTGNGRAMRISDLATQDELHALELYQTVYAPLGIEYQMAFTLPHTPQRVLGVALSRRERDFTDDERGLLERARPFLIQAYRNAILYSEALSAQERGGAARLPDIDALESLGLTPRQAEILRLLASGAAEREIATQLELSPRTVEKHLQHCFRRLGVENRAQAAARAWETVGAGA